MLSLVSRQQKQQQGNQLAKETDRLMKTFTSLPVGPDQVLNWSISLLVNSSVPNFWVFWPFYEHVLFFVCFSGRGRYRKSACWMISPLLWTASRRSSDRQQTKRKSLWPESELARGCRWVTCCAYVVFALCNSDLDTKQFKAAFNKSEYLFKHWVGPQFLLPGHTNITTPLKTDKHPILTLILVKLRCVSAF